MPGRGGEGEGRGREEGGGEGGREGRWKAVSCGERAGFRVTAANHTASCGDTKSDSVSAQCGNWRRRSGDRARPRALGRTLLKQGLSRHKLPALPAQQGSNRLPREGQLEEPHRWEAGGRGHQGGGTEGDGSPQDGGRPLHSARPLPRAPGPPPPPGPWPSGPSGIPASTHDLLPATFPPTPGQTADRRGRTPQGAARVCPTPVVRPQERAPHTSQDGSDRGDKR